jgi:hypothetical protein
MVARDTLANVASLPQGIYFDHGMIDPEKRRQESGHGRLDRIAVAYELARNKVLEARRVRA